MTLQYKVDNVSDLDPSIAALYKPEGDSFVLDVGGLEVDNEKALVNKKNELLSEVKAAKKRARELEASLQQYQSKEQLAEEEIARKAGDFEKIESAYKDKIGNLEQQLQSVVERSNKETIKRTAVGIASQLSDGHNQELLSEFIERRLKFDGDDVKVVDNEGNLSIQSLDELREEFRASDRFSSLITGSKASGSGATNQNGSAGGTAKTISRSDFDQKTPFEQASIVRGGTEIID